MGYNIKLIVPTDNELMVAPIVGQVLGHWGGCTVTTGKGWWNDAEKGQILDPLSILECSVDVWDQDAYEWWTDLATAVCATFDQDCVFLSIQDEKAMLIRADGMSRLTEKRDKRC